ncbi:hypothetical protein Btru_052334 [Bulinus truncatus]|nr:hypothetical protein Btru_052334 [Bulinus truncatus]
MSSGAMADSFPTINAEQLTKAAAGVLSAIDEDTIEENWQSNDKMASKQPSQSSLEMLENLSSSVCSELAKLNNLDLQKPVRHIPPFSNVSGRVKKYDGSIQPGAKKYSTRKNYKLLPTLIPTQLSVGHRKPVPEMVCSKQLSATHRKPMPEMVSSKQLVTLSNHANFHSPEKLKSMPVRLARYTTNYLLIKTAAPLQHSPIPDLSKAQNVNHSLRPPTISSGGDVSSCASTVTTSPGLSFTSPNSFPVAPKKMQQSNLTTLIISSGGKPTIQPVLRPVLRLPLAATSSRVPNAATSSLPNATLQNSNVLASTNCIADNSTNTTVTVAKLTSKDVTLISQSGQQPFSPLKISLSKPCLHSGFDSSARSEFHVIPTPSLSPIGQYSAMPEMTDTSNLNVFHLSRTNSITSAAKSLSQVKLSSSCCQLSSSTSSSTESKVNNVDTVAKHQSCLRVLLQSKPYTSPQLPAQNLSKNVLSVVHEPKLKYAEKSFQASKSPVSCNVSKLFELTTKSLVNSSNKNCTDAAKIDISEPLCTKPSNHLKLSTIVSQPGDESSDPICSNTTDMSSGISLSKVTCKSVTPSAELLPALLNDVKPQNLTSIPKSCSSDINVPGDLKFSGIDHQFEQVKESFLSLMKSSTRKIHPTVPAMSVSSQTHVTSSHPGARIRCSSGKHMQPNTIVPSVHDPFFLNSLPVGVVLSPAAATLPSTTGISQSDNTLKSLLNSYDPDKTEQNRSKTNLLLASTVCINKGNKNTVSQSTAVSSDTPKSLSGKMYREEESTTLSAAAAMVSLSETNISLGKPNQVSASNSPGIVSTSIGPLDPTPQFLISHDNRPRLVISQAGIRHLQDLLRKQGISEGYFVITSPRTAVPAPSKSKQQELLNKSDYSDSHYKKDLFIKENSNLTSLKGNFPDYLNICSSFSTSSEQPIGKETSSVEDVVDKENRSVCSQSAKVDSMCQDSYDRSVCPQSAKVDSMCQDSYESESDSSSESHSSCGALVIETGEDEDRQSNTTSSEKSDISLRKQLSESGESIFQNGQSDSVMPKKVSKLEESSWDVSNGTIAQSPLSLSDLIRQQQRPESLQPAPSAGVGDDFTFAMPLCPTTAYCAAHSHGNVEMSSGYQHNMFAANSLFSSDISYEAGTQNSGLDSHGHIAEIPTNASPKLLSRPMSVASPKSPLSVNSNQNLDHSTTLNPPMTPNTMLINLLNRVPTPLLTNHQDLLSVPTSQESPMNENDTALENFEIIQNKQERSIFPGSKNMSYSNVSEHSPPSLINSAQSENTKLLYNQETENVSSSSRKFVHNALELMSTNYHSEPIVSDEHHAHVSGEHHSLINNFSEATFTQCRGQETSLRFTENFMDDAKSSNNSQHFHCKSCSGPLVVTVNLDSNSPECAVKISHSCDEGKSAEDLLTSCAQSSMSLQKTDCSELPSGMQVNLIPFKSSETDILRHLILNTSSASFHSVPPGDQRFVSTPLTFDIPLNHIPQESHQYGCHVESFLDSRNQHKNMSQSTTYQPQDEQSTTYHPQDEQFLHSHSQSVSSFKNMKPSFTSASYQASGPYDGTDNRPYSEVDNSTLENSASTSYILQTNVPSFSIADMSKNNMPLVDQPFLESNERLQHLNEFRSDGQADTLFYQHPHDAQSDLHQQQDIHLYDSAHQHQGHELDYQLESLSQAHESHQYSSSLTPSSSSGIFDDHSENVGFIGNQFSSQYYDSTRMANSLTMFSQQCTVASEAPSNHSCNIPFSTAPTGLQLEFHFSPHDEEDGSHIEKQPVLPSASFSPPSVADPAVTPDPGGMGIYNGTFPNLSVYDMYVRGGNPDGRCGENDVTQELGNFCVECNTTYKSQCEFHPNEYSYIIDTPILTHARLTLPTCLKLKTSNIVGHTNNTGVFAKENIAVRTKFGPLIGSSVSCDQLGSTRSFSLWQTFSEKSTKVVDTSDENSSNWMMFVKPARLSSEHNLVAFQNGSSVYFVTRVDINPGEELLYWFSKDYARLLGITPNPKNVYYQLCPHCTVCKQIFPDRKQVRSHTRLQHPRPCTKKCSHCSRRFSQVSHLNAHITSVHLKVKKCVCPHCNKRFSDSSNFRKHVRAHSDERFFKCQICGKDFRQKAHLTHHMNTHMPVKNEQCGFCGVRFTRAFTRKQHELQHTKQNKIPCAHCNKIKKICKIY